jgi:hypothetical protein
LRDVHESDDFSHALSTGSVGAEIRKNPKAKRARRKNFPSMSWKNYEKRFILLLNAFNALQYRKSPPF